jgi:hypothetical protein
MSVEYVRLREKDLEILISVFQSVVDFKFKSLSKHNWQQFESDYMVKAIDAIRDNKFKVADAHNNILVWFIDQVVHSRKVVEGVPKADWIPLVDFDQVQECLSSLRAAAKGQISYNVYASSNTTFKTLFD